jgi:phage-related protein
VSTTRQLVHRGRRCCVYFVLTGSRCPAEDFFASLPSRDRDKSDLALHKLADYGPPRSEQKWRHLHAPAALWELKPTPQVRFIGFWDSPTDFVITHGFFKRRASDTRRQIEAASRMRDEYYADSDD